MDDIDLLNNKILELEEEIEIMKRQCSHNTQSYIEENQRKIKSLKLDIKIITLLKKHLES